MNIPLFPLLLALFFAAISVFIAWHGLKFFFQAMKMFRDDSSTTAVVTQILLEPRTRKGRTWMEKSAVLSFETHAHEKREVKYSASFGSLKLEPGDRLKIWYHETDPEVFTPGWRYFLWDMFSILFFVLCLGLPSWTFLVHVLRGLLHW